VNFVIHGRVQRALKLYGSTVKNVPYLFVQDVNVDIVATMKTFGKDSI
jgi:hypothetical protein